MAEYDRKEQLKAIHKSRKSATHQKVDVAFSGLVRANGAINFNSVANEAGVSKATLYNNQELRQRIEALRRQRSTSTHTKTNPA